MTFGTQEGIVALIVLGAALSVAQRWFGFRFKPRKQTGRVIEGNALVRSRRR